MTPLEQIQARLAELKEAKISYTPSTGPFIATTPHDWLNLLKVIELQSAALHEISNQPMTCFLTSSMGMSDKMVKADVALTQTAKLLNGEG